MFAKKNVDETLTAIEMMIGNETTTTENTCNAYC